MTRTVATTSFISVRDQHHADRYGTLNSALAGGVTAFSCGRGSWASQRVRHPIRAVYGSGSPRALPPAGSSTPRRSDGRWSPRTGGHRRPSVMSVLPFGSRCAPLMFELKNWRRPCTTRRASSSPDRSRARANSAARTPRCPGRHTARWTVAARSAIVEDQQVARAGQTLGDQMRVMLPDDLADRAQRVRLEEVGPEPPDDRAVAGDDGEQARLAAADDHVVRREPLVAGVEPSVGADIRGRIQVKPVERRRTATAGPRSAPPAPPRAHHRARRRARPAARPPSPARASRSRRVRRVEAELVDVIAGDPLPQDLALRRQFDDAIVLKQHVTRQSGYTPIGVCQDRACCCRNAQGSTQASNSRPGKSSRCQS